MPLDLRTRILCRNGISSPLGRISLAGVIHHSSGFLRRPMRILGSFAAVLLVEGQGGYEDAAGASRSVQAGGVILIFPELGHRYGPRSGEQWSEIYLVFDGPAFELMRERGVLRPEQPVHHVEPVAYWFRRFEAVLAPPSRSQPGSSVAEVCRAQSLLADALASAAQAQAGTSALRGWTQRACALLATDLEQPLPAEQVARQMGLSYETFRKRFTRAVGMPPARYRHVRIMDCACEWMHAGRASDKQIARLLGFCNESHFSRQFKKIVGCSPRAFRQRLPWSR